MRSPLTIAAYAAIAAGFGGHFLMKFVAHLFGGFQL